MALIRRTDIDEVRARVNIADIIGDHVTLKGAGVGALKGLCPFHDERSPSFHVRPGVGRYHCFGCGEDGDVFTFLQRMEHVSFTEAVERMAARIGYELHYEDGQGPRTDHGQRSRLLAVNQSASEFFQKALQGPEAEPARRFLLERGFDRAAVERFGVGFAPRSYDALGTALAAQGFTKEELLASGVQGQGERGSYDRFRGRIVWPIRDTTGQTLGFGARRLFDDDQGPKYLNTPETAVYHKAQVLYGLDLARREIARDRRVVVVEGYTDVMACHLAGVTTAVATCGTAFGVEHIKLIRRVLGDVDNADARGVGEVIFTFDPDEAGQRAAGRAFEEEHRFAAQTFVAVAPDGLDPADLRLQRGDEAVRLLVEERKPMFEFMIRRRLAGFDLDTVDGRVGALRAAAPVFSRIRDRALHAGYVRSLAGWLGVAPGEVERAVTAAARGGAEPAARPAEETPRPGEATLAELPSDPVTRLERDALMAVLQEPAAIGVERIRQVASARFVAPALSVVRDAVAVVADDALEAGWLDRVAEQAPAPFVSLVRQLGMAPLPEKPGRGLGVYCRAITASLLERELLARKAELLGALQRTDAAAEPERYTALQRELVELERERRALRED